MTVKPESTFFTKPTKWNEGVRRGFIVRPQDDDGNVWGQPYEDPETGDLIVPGTENGPHANALLGIKDGEWKILRHEKLQSAGNIDWKGPWQNDAATKREVVTVSGPRQRYWNYGDHYTYGEFNSDNYVHYNGRVVGITPKPVLGACLVEKETFVYDEFGNHLVNYETNQFLTAPKKWLVVICKGGDEGEKDICYIKKEMNFMHAEDITQEVFDVAKRTEKEVDDEYIYEPGVAKPLGWKPVGETIGYTDEIPSLAPEAPWFFDVEGTGARTMRRCEWTHSDNGPTDFEDQMYREMHCNIDLTEDRESAVFSLADPLSSIKGAFSYATWQFNLDCIKTQYAYHQPLEIVPDDGGSKPQPEGDGFEHDFQIDDIDFLSYLAGECKVAVDFNPDLDRWVYGWLTGISQRRFGQIWAKGTDAPNTAQDDLDGREANTDNEDGPQPDIFEKHGFPGPYPSIWYGFGDNVTLNINESGVSPVAKHAEITLQWAKSGTASVQAGGEPDPEDNLLTFIDHYSTWIQYCDIRHNMVVGFVDFSTIAVTENLELWQLQEDWIQWSIVADPLGLGEATANYDYESPDALWREGYENVFFMWHQNYEGIGGLNESWAGWTREEMEAWDNSEGTTDFEYSFDNENPIAGFNFSGHTPETNSDESIYEPYWLDFVPDWMKFAPVAYWKPISVTDSLRGSNVDSYGVFGTTEKGESLVAMEFFDYSEKEWVSVAAGWEVAGEPLDALKGDKQKGTKIVPGGLL